MRLALAAGLFATGAIAAGACGEGRGGEATPAAGATSAASDVVLRPGTYRARAHARAVDYPDQTAVAEGELRISNTARGRDGVVARFQGDTVGRGYSNPYDGTVRSAGDTVWVALFCTSCRVNAALGPVSRTTEWSGRYRARALGGDRFELRQVPDAGDPPGLRLAVDTLVRLAR